MALSVFEEAVTTLVKGPETVGIDAFNKANQILANIAGYDDISDTDLVRGINENSDPNVVFHLFDAISKRFIAQDRNYNTETIREMWKYLLDQSFKIEDRFLRIRGFKCVAVILHRYAFYELFDEGGVDGLGPFLAYFTEFSAEKRGIVTIGFIEELLFELSGAWRSQSNRAFDFELRIRNRFNESLMCPLVKLCISAFKSSAEEIAYTEYPNTVPFLRQMFSIFHHFVYWSDRNPTSCEHDENLPSVISGAYFRPSHKWADTIIPLMPLLFDLQSMVLSSPELMMASLEVLTRMSYLAGPVFPSNEARDGYYEQFITKLDAMLENFTIDDGCLYYVVNIVNNLILSIDRLEMNCPSLALFAPKLAQMLTDIIVNAVKHIVSGESHSPLMLEQCRSTVNILSRLFEDEKFAEKFFLPAVQRVFQVIDDNNFELDEDIESEANEIIRIIVDLGKFDFNNFANFVVESFRIQVDAIRDCTDKTQLQCNLNRLNWLLRTMAEFLSIFTNNRTHQDASHLYGLINECLVSNLYNFDPTIGYSVLYKASLEGHIPVIDQQIDPIGLFLSHVLWWMSKLADSLTISEDPASQQVWFSSLMVLKEATKCLDESGVRVPISDKYKCIFTLPENLNASFVNWMLKIIFHHVFPYCHIVSTELVNVATECFYGLISARFLNHHFDLILPYLTSDIVLVPSVRKLFGWLVAACGAYQTEFKVNTNFFIHVNNCAKTFFEMMSKDDGTDNSGLILGYLRIFSGVADSLTLQGCSEFAAPVIIVFNNLINIYSHYQKSDAIVDAVLDFFAVASFRISDCFPQEKHLDTYSVNYIGFLQYYCQALSTRWSTVNVNTEDEEFKHLMMLMENVKDVLNRSMLVDSNDAPRPHKVVCDGVLNVFVPVISSNDMLTIPDVFEVFAEMIQSIAEAARQILYTNQHRALLQAFFTTSLSYSRGEASLIRALCTLKHMIIGDMLQQYPEWNTYFCEIFPVLFGIAINDAGNYTVFRTSVDIMLYIVVTNKNFIHSNFFVPLTESQPNDDAKTAVFDATRKFMAFDACMPSPSRPSSLKWQFQDAFNIFVKDVAGKMRYNQVSNC